MAAAAHDPKFAKRVGIPQSVAKDFNEADKGKNGLKSGDNKISLTEAKNLRKPCVTWNKSNYSLTIVSIVHK